MSLDTYLEPLPLVPILRGITPADAPAVAQTALGCRRTPPAPVPDVSSFAGPSVLLIMPAPSLCVDWIVGLYTE